jgi:hypothetical protein
MLKVFLAINTFAKGNEMKILRATHCEYEIVLGRNEK